MGRSGFSTLVRELVELDFNSASHRGAVSGPQIPIVHPMLAPISLAGVSHAVQSTAS